MSAEPSPMTVKVIDVDVSFWNLVGLLIKLAFASIPAILVVTAVVVVIMSFFGGLAGGTDK